MAGGQHLQNMENSTTDEFCIKQGIEVVTYPYYRAMQIIHIVLSIGSVVLILWVLKKYRKKLIFHYNIRILVTSLFLASLLHSTLMTIFECYQLYLSFTYVKPCDVMLPRMFYITVHMPFIFSVMWIEATQSRATYLWDEGMERGQWDPYTEKRKVEHLQKEKGNKTQNWSFFVVGAKLCLPRTKR
ncbi:hypothetical protein ANCDUO_13356 [Ancylostoma duodenale]|uniref:Uncharacterized protein n=1 Tax=Ancylostoma duodenale TaxID=51022 RepID=A0A0C2CJ65_9BILA|nr:hypothetical protein ANCDUO_13356 [Ancylostoma duodenale]